MFEALLTIQYPDIKYQVVISRRHPTHGLPPETIENHLSLENA